MKHLRYAICLLLGLSALASIGAIALAAAPTSRAEISPNLVQSQAPKPHGNGSGKRISVLASTPNFETSPRVQSNGDAIHGALFGGDVREAQWNSWEVTVAADPIHPLNFLSAFIDRRGSTHSLTTDGGATWTRATTTDGLGDPSAAFDLEGNAYLSQLTADRNNVTCPDPMRVFKSGDGGLVFNSGAVALSDLQPSDHFLDKDWLMVDTQASSPFAGRIYAAATDFYVPNCNLDYSVNNRMVIAYSTDRGNTWSPSVTVSDPQHDQNQFAHMVAAPNGTVYYSYQYQNCGLACDGVPASNMITRSTDGGLSWSANITITGQPISYTGAFVDGYAYLTPGLRHNDQSILGISPTNSNVVYSLWTDGRWESTFTYGGVTGRHADIAFSRSTDSGITWGAPIRVNDDALGNGADQFFPWLAVSNDGTLHASWLDRRDNSQDAYREYYSQSTDGGQTWSANTPVAEAESRPLDFIGDYMGLGVNPGGTMAMMSWTDARDGALAPLVYGNHLSIQPAPITGTPTSTPSPTGQVTPTPACDPNWQSVASPNGDSYVNTLAGIAAITSNDIWAVGSAKSGFSTLIEHWNGSEWSLVPSPNGGALHNELRAVSAASANDVWAVGVYEQGPRFTGLIEHWNGSEWSLVPTVDPGTGAEFLNGITALGSNNAWIVGYVTSYEGNGFTLTLHWDGVTWSLVSSPNVGQTTDESDYLNAVSAVSADDIWAVGSYTIIGLLKTLTLHWNGSQWSIVASPQGHGHLYYLNGVTALATNDVWAVGSYGYAYEPRKPLIIHWNGTQWSVIDGASAGTGGTFLQSISGTQNNLWAAGYYRDSSGQHTLVEHWDGTAWTTVSSPNPAANRVALNGIVVISGTDIWAVGSSYNGTPDRTLIERYYPCGGTPTPSVVSSATPSTTPSTTPSVCTIQFSDVPEGSTFYAYVHCLACLGIVSGYEDGTFRPGNNVTRGQAAKFISNSAGYQDTIPPDQQSFSDVPTSNTFWVFIERVNLHGAISGYECGGEGEPCPGRYFRPANDLTRGQLAKIDSEAFGYNDMIPPDRQTFNDVQPGSTFWLYIERLALHSVIGGYECGGVGEPCPGVYYRTFNNVTRGQMSKIVANTFFPQCQARLSH